MEQRERLGSRLGFILLSAGCAIGMGNVWKFPYLAGQNGGGFFVLVYLLFVAILGIPVMTMEFAVGRASQKSPVHMHHPLTKKGSPWRIHGWAAFLGVVVLMMFYAVVAGWMLNYFVKTATGTFVGMDADQVAGVFGAMMGSPAELLGYMAIVVVLGFGICSFSLQKGVERVTKWMMVALLGIMVVLAINSMLLPGGSEGLSFYLKPNMDRVREIGLGTVIVNAMNQSFFSLSLGIGSMAIFGSYINKDRALMGESVNVAILDTFVALTAGLIIFPACFAYGVEPGAGPSLVFITLPNIFNNMPMGRLWGSLFFVFMTFAALTTVVAVFEAIVACTCDATGWSRKKACLVCGIAMFFLCIPCALGFNLWSGFVPFAEGTAIMDIEDLLVSYILLPLGSLAFVLFCTSRYGWGWDNFIAEANEGKGLKFPKWLRFYVAYILPVIVIVLFIIGMVQFPWK